MAGIDYGVQFHPGVFQLPAEGHRFFRRGNTYLAMIACVLQETPEKRLTFVQLMVKLQEFVGTGDRKCFENNIRVCLSYNKCFIKVPINPSDPSCRLNYWKLDHAQITPKMAWRHFKKHLCEFPELAHKMALSPPQGPMMTVAHSPDPAHCSAPPTRGGTKFRGPFSIESLLRRDSPSIQGSKRSPPLPPPPFPPPLHRSCLAVQVERLPGPPEGQDDRRKGWLRGDYQPLERVLQGPAKRWPSYDDQREGELGARPFKRIYTEPSAARIQQRHGLAPYTSGPQINSASRFACDFHHIRL